MSITIPWVRIIHIINFVHLNADLPPEEPTQPEPSHLGHTCYSNGVWNIDSDLPFPCRLVPPSNFDSTFPSTVPLTASAPGVRSTDGFTRHSNSLNRLLTLLHDRTPDGAPSFRLLLHFSRAHSLLSSLYGIAEEPCFSPTSQYTYLRSSPNIHDLHTLSDDSYLIGASLKIVRQFFTRGIPTARHNVAPQILCPECSVSTASRIRFRNIVNILTIFFANSLSGCPSGWNSTHIRLFQPSTSFSRY